jgi:colanic acid/amylovoran biosynthesis protein
MNVLLLNAHSAQNAGDLAILQESIACLHAAFPGAAITVAINDLETDELPSGAAYVASLTRWLLRPLPSGEWRWRKPLAPPYAIRLLLAALLFRWVGRRWQPRHGERRRLLDAYYDADIVAVIGGGHLYARHAFNIAFIWLWFGLALALWMGKPLIFLPQSFGPLPGRLQRGLLRWLLARSALLAAREYRSLDLLAAIGLRRRVLVLPDLAFALADTSTTLAAYPELERALQHAARPLIGLTLMDWGGQNPTFQNQAGYEAAILALIAHVRQSYGATVMLFAQCYGPVAAQDDRRIARRIAAQAGPADSVVLVDQALPAEALKAAYRQLDALVATRMHSAIFAMSAGVPTLAIGYLHKSIGIMEMLGLERYALEIDSLDAQRLCAAFDHLWAERPAVRQQLDSRIPVMRATLERLPLLIRRSIER